MKYIMLLLFLVQGINTNVYSQDIVVEWQNNTKEVVKDTTSSSDWCINQNQVLEWTLVNKEKDIVVFSKEELSSMSEEDYKLLYENYRIKRLLFSIKDFNKEKNFCLDSREVEEWVLMNKVGKNYIFTSEELNSLPTDKYDFIHNHLRVQSVVFRDID